MSVETRPFDPSEYIAIWEALTNGIPLMRRSIGRGAALARHAPERDRDGLTHLPRSRAVAAICGPNYGDCR